MDKAVDINCYMLVKMKNRYVNLSNLSFRNSFLFFYFLSQVKVETDIKLKLIIHMAFKPFECQPFFFLPFNNQEGIHKSSIVFLNQPRTYIFAWR